MLTTETKLSTYQGVVTLGRRNTLTGAVEKVFDIGNVPELDIALKVTVEDIKESQTGQRLGLARIEGAKEASITMKLHNFDGRTQELILRATANTVVGGTVTAEAHGSGKIDGDIVKLDHNFVSLLVVKDSAAAPATVPNTKYQIDPNGGMLRLADVAGYIQPFTFDYAYAAVDTVAMFTSAQLEYCLYFSGVNTARSSEPIMMELYRTAFDPADNLPLIGEKVSVYTLKGSLLADLTKDGSDPTLGYFGRIQTKAA